MSAFLSSVFGRPANRPPANSNRVQTNGLPISPNHPDSGSSTPRSDRQQITSPLAPLSASSSRSDSADNRSSMQSYHNSRPIWSQEQYVKQFVKGNFMTIVAKPAIIEIGEWFAHQISEHNRVLHYFIQCIISNDPNEPNICNAETCPRMTAGPRHSYTWLDSSRQQTYPPACEYINNVLRWMRGQVEDRRIFPIDPRTVSAAAATYASGSVNPAPAHTPGSAAPAGFNGPLSVSSGRTWVGKDSGFPESFNSICKGLCKQIFRIYAHLYWNHFVHPFYHVNLDAHLNSAFTTFICFAHESKLLGANDVVPMQPLIDVLVHQGVVPSFT